METITLTRRTKDGEVEFAVAEKDSKAEQDLRAIGFGEEVEKVKHNSRPRKKKA